MLTTDMRRTNGVPLTVAILCLVLLVARIAATAWTVFTKNKPLAESITWRDAAELSQPDSALTGKPRLLFFYKKQPIPFEQLFESTVLNNRLLVASIKQNFVAYRIAHDTGSETSTTDEHIKKLIDDYSVTGPIEVIAALPDGFEISSSGATSDKGLNAFLEDVLRSRTWAISKDLMHKGDFAEAAQLLLERRKERADTKENDVRHLMYAAALFSFAGQKNKALEACKPDFTHAETWPAACLQYYAGQLPEQALARLADDRQKKYDANFIRATKALEDGKKQEAIDLLQKSSGLDDSGRNAIALAELEKLTGNKEADDDKSPDQASQIPEKADDKH